MQERTYTDEALRAANLASVANLEGRLATVQDALFSGFYPEAIDPKWDGFFSKPLAFMALGRLRRGLQPDVNSSEIAWRSKLIGQELYGEAFTPAVRRAHLSFIADRLLGETVDWDDLTDVREYPLLRAQLGNLQTRLEA